MADAVISFVSLGPGDPKLRTERAVERLSQADIVVGDADGLPAERLVELARLGKRLVRAVGGDALESPHVVAEILATARAGGSIEVVPGVDSRAVAAAFAGVLGGRSVRVSAEGVGRAVAGEPPSAPVTLIADPGSATQRVIVTTAADAPERARELAAGPLVVVSGEPDEFLRWFERRPLFGKRVLVTRAFEQAGGTAALLREHGAEALVVPTIEIHPPGDPGPLSRALGGLRSASYAWVAFTSANGVERTWEAVTAGGGDARLFGASRLAAIGPATARALRGHGLHADVVAKEFRGERLADEMIDAIRAGLPSPRVLIARAARARDELPDALRAAGCVVDVVAAYETRRPTPETAAFLVHELESGRLDAVTFTSSSTVENLCDLLGPGAATLLGQTRVASIGPVTTQSARARGVRVDVTANPYTVPSLVQALADSYGQKRLWSPPP